MPLTRNPSSYDLPPPMREPRGGTGRRGSFKQEMASTGVSVEAFLELAKRDSAAAKTLGEQLKRMIDSGASQQDIAEFFRN